MDNSKIDMIKTNVAIAQGTMQQTLEEAIRRDDQIDKMEQEAIKTNDAAHAFRKGATTLKMKTRWEKYRTWILVGSVIVAVVIIIIIVAAV